MKRLAKVLVLFAVSIMFFMPTKEAKAGILGIEFQYLQFTNIDYTYARSPTYTPATGNGDAEGMDPGFNPSYRLIYKQGNITYSIQHSEVSESESVIGTYAFILAAPGSTTGYSGLNIYDCPLCKIETELEARLTVYDVEVANVISSSDDFFLYFLAGLRIVDFDMNTRTLYQSGTIAGPDFDENVRLDNSYLGYGVKTGLKANYKLSDNFSLAATFTYAILYGESGYNYYHDYSNVKVNRSSGRNASIMETSLKAIFGPPESIQYWVSFEAQTIESAITRDMPFSFDLEDNTLETSGDIGTQSFSAGMKLVF